eukprot:31239-Pelagococcus_subviridis.AAC.5
MKGRSRWGGGRSRAGGRGTRVRIGVEARVSHQTEYAYIRARAGEIFFVRNPREKPRAHPPAVPLSAAPAVPNTHAPWASAKPSAVPTPPLA